MNTTGEMIGAMGFATRAKMISAVVVTTLRTKENLHRLQVQL